MSDTPELDSVAFPRIDGEPSQIPLWKHAVDLEVARVICRQRNELLHVLEEILSSQSAILDELRRKAQAAIAKVEGGAS